jgi:hypothetical protein
MKVYDIERPAGCSAGVLSNFELETRLFTTEPPRLYFLRTVAISVASAINKDSFS